MTDRIYIEEKMKPYQKGTSTLIKGTRTSTTAKLMMLKEDKTFCQVSNANENRDKNPATKYDRPCPLRT